MAASVVQVTDSTCGFQALWSDRAPRVYFDRTAVNAASILSGLPVEVVRRDADADLVWIREKPHEWYGALAPHQALNHIPGQSAMVTKAGLARHLHRYGEAHPGAAFSHVQFLQPTYCLSDPAEAAAFVAQLPAEDTPDNLWILKPSTLSKGRGVRVLWRFDWLRTALRQHGRIVFRYQRQEHEYVVQRYIKDVLLLDGK